MEEAKKRDRYKREPTPNFRLRLNERQVQILLTLNDYPLLRSTWLFAFDGKKNKVKFLANLTYLFHDCGLVERVSEYDRWKGNASPAIYRLSPSGKDYLRELGHEVGDTVFNDTNVPHSLLACDIIADIELACANRDDIRFIPKQDLLQNAPIKTRKLPHPFAIPVTISDPSINEPPVKTRYVADGWFGIDQGGKRHYYCLEVNHSNNVDNLRTLSVASHRRKFLSFRELRRTFFFEDEFGLDGSVTALFVQTRASVTNNSKRLLSELTGGKPAPHFAFRTAQTFLQERHAALPDGRYFNAIWERVHLPPINISEV